MLLDESPHVTSRVRLKLYGNAGKKDKKTVQEFRYRSVVEFFGKIRREDALDAMKKGTVLLLIQNTDGVSSETIPSKVYEYLLTERPILALLFRNPELQLLLEGMGHIVVQGDDEIAIKKGLETYVGKWERNQLQSTITKSPYTVQKAVGELVTLVEGIKDAEGR